MLFPISFSKLEGIKTLESSNNNKDEGQEGKAR